MFDSKLPALPPLGVLSPFLQFHSNTVNFYCVKRLAFVRIDSIACLFMKEDFANESINRQPDCLLLIWSLVFVSEAHSGPQKRTLCASCRLLWALCDLPVPGLLLAWVSRTSELKTFSLTPCLSQNLSSLCFCCWSFLSRSLKRAPGEPSPKELVNGQLKSF